MIRHFADLDVPRFLYSISNAELKVLRELVICELKRRYKHKPEDPPPPEDYAELTPPDGRKCKPLFCSKSSWLSAKNIDYFQCLIAQDWSFLFDDLATDHRTDYYVYSHVVPTGVTCSMSWIKKMNLKGPPFYIGKGRGGRAFDFNRNQGHQKILKSVLESGHKPEDITNILFDNLTEAKALELESKLIYYFGTKYDITRKGGILCNLDIGRRPLFNTRRPVANTRCHKTIIRRRG